MGTTFTTSGEPRTTTRVLPRPSSGRVFWSPTIIKTNFKSATRGGSSRKTFTAQPIVEIKTDATGKCTIKWEELGNSSYGNPVVPADKRADLSAHPTLTGGVAKKTLAALEDECQGTIPEMRDTPSGGPDRWLIIHIVLKSGCPEGGEVEKWVLFWVDGDGAHAVGVTSLWWPIALAWNSAPSVRVP